MRKHIENLLGGASIITIMGFLAFGLGYLLHTYPIITLGGLAITTSYFLGALIREIWYG